MDSACVKVGYRVDDVNYLREMFTSFTDQVIMVRLTADRPGKITFNAVLTTPHQDRQRARVQRGRAAFVPHLLLWLVDAAAQYCDRVAGGVGFGGT